jgi:hypothetical protein
VLPALLNVGVERGGGGAETQCFRSRQPCQPDNTKNQTPNTPPQNQKTHPARRCDGDGFNPVEHFGAQLEEAGFRWGALTGV